MHDAPMVYRKATMVCSLLGLMALAGCGAAMSEKDCRAANWYNRGFDDALRGQPKSTLDGYTRACSEYNVSLDRNAWWLGHEWGLATYCSIRPGYDIGRYGADYQNTCADRPGEAAFLTGYIRGLVDRREKLDGEMVMLRRRLSGFDSRSQIEAVTQRARIVQAESRRAELSLVWADQRLHVLAERVK